MCIPYSQVLAGVQVVMGDRTGRFNMLMRLCKSHPTRLHLPYTLLHYSERFLASQVERTVLMYLSYDPFSHSAGLSSLLYSLVRIPI